MDRFIAKENIRHFRQQLKDCNDEARKRTLEQLLVSEVEKLRALERRGR